MSSGSDRAEPLLPSSPAGRSSLARQLALGVGLLLYLPAGALERVCFTRMAARLGDDLILIHTLLSVLSLALFVLLGLARAQNTRVHLSEQLQRLHPSDLLQMATLDTIHTLLALYGAAGVPGTMQALLLQGAVPIRLFISAVIPQSASPEGETSVCPLMVRLRRGMDYFSLSAWLSSRRCCRDLGLLLISSLMLGAAIIGPGVLCDLDEPSLLHWPSQRDASMTLAPVLNFTPPDLPPPNLADNTERRGVFVLSLVFGALAVVHKQRCLSCRPTDVVILNAWLAFSQIIAGLIIGPPLLLVLHSQSPVLTLSQLARGIKCCTSGFSSVPAVAGYAPLILVFFIMSTVWSTISYILLRYGNQVLLTIGSALLLPATLLAFLRPVPLPYSWAAPPEPLSQYGTLVSAAMIVALIMYHGATLRELWRAERLVRSLQELNTAHENADLLQRDLSGL